MNGPAPPQSDTLTPKRFLLLPFGSAGDLHPFLAIGCELSRRGHEVLLASNPVHRRLVESHGLPFHAVGTFEEMAQAGHDPALRNHSSSWKVAIQSTPLRQVRSVYEWIESAYEPGRTAVVAQSIMFGARIAQEKLGAPLATIHLEPGCFRSVYKSPVMPPPLWMSRGVPRFWKRTQLWIADRYFVDPTLEPINDFRAELGLEPVRRFLHEWWHSPDLALGLFPEWYASPQPDWPASTKLTGFLRWDPDPDAAVDAEIESFLQEGDAPIVFTAGSAGFADGSFYSESVAAAQRLGRRAILLSRRNELLPPTLPEGIRAFAFVPFEKILPRAACLVHHGGIGTVAQALASGVPQLVMPVAFNQPDEAARLARFGVADRISPRRYRAEEVAAKLQRLISSPDVARRCADLARRFDGAEPLAPTCDALEELLDRKAGGQRLSAAAAGLDRASAGR
ncbi:MAG TPA: nucleotide disphospho-sugar-binding domain-containing protein [Pirellulaceae bacterium]|jgi:UDP:flavonoid glycosyltransferase YjiC (YdhE family)|nr:nucleotide disphospho-sugar-binding domain-containing protein [Pirellulaceae bacterium]